MERDVINLAGKLKQKYNSANPFIICEQMGIQIKYVPFMNNPKGQFQELLGRSVILLSHELKESEERFYICAHELGHAIFHKGLSSYYVSTRNSRSKSESEANCFAANLIADLYKEETQMYPRKIEDLSRLYGLPVSAYRFLIQLIMNCAFALWGKRERYSSLIWRRLSLPALSGSNNIFLEEK